MHLPTDGRSMWIIEMLRCKIKLDTIDGLVVLYAQKSCPFHGSSIPWSLYKMDKNSWTYSSSTNTSCSNLLRGIFFSCLIDWLVGWCRSINYDWLLRNMSVQLEARDPEPPSHRHRRPGLGTAWPRSVDKYYLKFKFFLVYKYLMSKRSCPPLYSDSIVI